MMHRQNYNYRANVDGENSDLRPGRHRERNSVDFELMAPRLWHWRSPPMSHVAIYWVQGFGWSTLGCLLPVCGTTYRRLRQALTMLHMCWIRNVTGRVSSSHLSLGVRSARPL